MLHVWVPLSLPTQPAPLQDACWLNVLVLSWVPPPQAALQVPHALHAPQTQLTVGRKMKLKVTHLFYTSRCVELLIHDIPGQQLELHVWASMSLPTQSAPLLRAGCWIVLLLSWVPPPQVAVQVSHALHEPQTQLTDTGIKGYENIYMFYSFIKGTISKLVM